MKTNVGHFYDMFQFSWLFLNFGRQEECSCCDGIAMESLEGMEHVETLHVNNGRVDAKLSPESIFLALKIVPLSPF